MKYDYEDNGIRETLLKGVHRVVIKVGSRLLLDMDGAPEEERIGQLVAEIASLRQKGLQVILVSSGAIGTGLVQLGTPTRPKSMAGLQAHGAVGQCQLMTYYVEACRRHGFSCAQLLLTAADLHDRERHLCVSQCLNELLNLDVLPVINENDSVCVDEIKVGDNDRLAALVAGICRAELTLLLTTIDGMREREPETGALGKRISVMMEMDETVRSMAKGTDGNRFSVGGMHTKLLAADIVTNSGECLWIADGHDFAIIRSVFNGDDVGTLFRPSRRLRMHAWQRYLAFFAQIQGTLIVDAGAEKALTASGKSLLPGGVIGLRGIFKRGDAVRIIGLDGTEIARGIVNFSTADLSLICGAHTSRLKELLGHTPVDEVAVHRDNMVIMQ